jgi:hypothetical protein
MIVSCLENITFLAIKRQLAVDRWRFSARVIVGGTIAKEHFHHSSSPISLVAVRPYINSIYVIFSKHETIISCPPMYDL